MSYLPAYRPALGTTDVDTPIPVPGQAQPPIWPLQIGNHGGYMEVRSTPADGACGVGTYPCKHPGLDVVGMAGTPVKAPDSGTVVLAMDGSGSPVGGYGPWVLIIQSSVDGKFHLLGHLDPTLASQAPVGATVTAGDVVGVTSSANHTHWEVRQAMTPNFAAGETNADNNMDPQDWLAGRQGVAGWTSVLLLGAAAGLFYLLWRD